MTQGATPSHPENPRRRPTAPIGLYDPAFEHDSCGVAFVARLNGIPSHETLERAMTALENLEHRGAAGADPLTGDGAGHAAAAAGRVLPRGDRRGAAARRRLRRRGLLPAARTTRPAGPSSSRSSSTRSRARASASSAGATSRCELDTIGETAREVAPIVRQLVVAASHELAADRDAFERKLYVIRRIAEIAAGPELVIPSFSARTIVYKGMLMAPQLGPATPTCSTSG